MLLDSLNPFEFRASIYSDMEWGTSGKERVLIPLNSGLVFTQRPATTTPAVCLNPFEFRASIYSLIGDRYETRKRLNPFEFRASIYSCWLESPDLNALVLIPLNSGLVFTPAPLANSAR